MNPLNQIDAYKLDHRRQYPAGTQFVYSNFTPRSSRVDGQRSVVNFGLQAFLKNYCERTFNEWFKRPEDEVCAEYATMTANVLGPNSIGTDHIRELHKLGYLPLKFKALPEGALVPLGVPLFTVENTDPRFFWLVNYIETVLSASIWMPSTSATTAHRIRKVLDSWALATGDPGFVQWQGHDFSFRGHSSAESAAASGAGHLISFTGTDTIPAIDWITDNYPGNNGFIGGSVAATEHSVMCAGGAEGELQTFERLLALYPTGILSVVSDTWDLWKVLDEILPTLKDKILARDGKLVIRPDSGDPVDIICGTADGFALGAIDYLDKHFGTTVNSKGYKELNPKVGLIYGDSISEERADSICRRLARKGYASTNIVFGVGSYTYQFVTRDTFGFAMKATHAIIDSVGNDLFKDPVTDKAIGGSKKSAKGRLAVVKTNGEYKLVEQASNVQDDQLKLVWINGNTVKEWSFAEVRENLKNS
jgi:nicotinamide phosphoribosyltransferase